MTDDASFTEINKRTVQSSEGITVCQTGCDMPTVNITFVVPSEELSDTEKEKTKLYKEFCTIFKAGILSTSQKRALYLKNYQDQAAALISEALENTR